MHTSFVRGSGPSGPGDEPDPAMRRAGRFDAIRAAVEADPEPTHRVAHEATLGLLDRAGRAGEGGYPEGWDLFARAAAALVGTEGWAVTVGVMANMLALVDLAEPSDFVATSAIAKRYGHRKVAETQTTVDELLGSGPDLPVATRMVMVLSLTDEIAEALQEAGHDKETATDIAHRCYQTGFWLVMTDVDPSAPGPRLTTPEDVVEVWDRGGIRAWRAQVAVLASNPWTPYFHELRELAIAAGRPQPVHALDEAVRVYRARFERRERELVAREIRRLVAVSGLSQREFAAMSGTSASRLSTYVNGLVTPSATMMVRIRRVSALAQRRTGLTDDPS